MEYLMTYGWAVLIVMVVGVALWQFGIFNMGGSIPPTSSGFQGFVPLLATCSMGNHALNWGPNWYYSGFGCQFVNNQGTDLIFRNIDLKVNGKYCTWASIASNQDPNGGTWLWEHQCETESSCTAMIPTAYYSGPGDSLSSPYYCSGIRCLTLPKDYQLHIRTVSPNPFMYAPLGECYPTEGKTFDVDIDIQYDVAVGGVTTSKHSVGKIHIIGNS
jgi:hypothetical protein